MNRINTGFISRYFPRASLALALGAMTAGMAACAATPTSESTGGYVDDSAITAKVKTDLARDSQVSATSVHVRTYKDVVDLSGFVNSQTQVAEAKRVASQVNGVQSVHDNLIVKQVAAPPTQTEERVQ